MRQDYNRFVIAFRRLYKSILGFEEGSDIQETIEGIKKDIAFRGHTAWILMFSIFIASIGLNVNSTAVIIGAMLISPLMGPILGIGLAIGTNDFETLYRSFRNLGIAIGISLATSTLYFIITPLDIEQSEILARTEPTLLDVLVALFGGFAGIIAGSQKEKTNVVPGVAIATALMPPLCTAGYGLANLRFDYFLGAFYLFFINSVFISLATFIVVRYLKFPLLNNIYSQKLKRYRIYLTIFLVLTIIPSAIIFYNVIQEARFNVSVEKFVKDHCSFENSELISFKSNYNDTLSSLALYYIGDEVEEDKYLSLVNHLPDYGLVNSDFFAITNKTTIKIHQENDADPINLDEKLTAFNNDLRISILEDIYTKNNEIIKDKDLKIQLLEQELLKHTAKNADTFPYYQIGKELKFHFPIISQYAFSNTVEHKSMNNSIVQDTIPAFLIRFKKGYGNSHRKKVLNEAEGWLRVRLNKNQLEAIEY